MTGREAVRHGWASWARELLMTGGGDAGEDGFKVGVDVGIWNAKDTEAARGEPAGALGVVVSLVVVNGTVQFNDEGRRVTVEIQNEAVDNLLPPEMQAMESIPAHALPHPGFLWGQGAPQLLGSLEFFLVYQLAANNSGWSFHFGAVSSLHHAAGLLVSA